LEIVKGRDHSKYLGIDKKMDLSEMGFGVWIGWIWLRMGTGGGFL
jgi:hypothetical protein